MRLYRCATGLAILILALVGGCGFMPQAGSNNKGKLEGTRWVNEPGVFVGIPLIRGAFTMDFRGDGTFYWRFSDKTFTGTFSYGPENLIFFTLSEPFLNRTDWKEHITISGDTMIMGGEDGITLNFYRYKGMQNTPAKEPPKANTAPEPPKEVVGTKPKRPGTKPQDWIQGEYEITEESLDGIIHPAAEFRNTRVIFLADKFQVLVNGKAVVEATYKCDFAKEPAHLDVKYLTGSKQGKTELGVVRVTENVLEFTLAEEGNPRPTEFNAYQGWKRNRFLLHWLK